MTYLARAFASCITTTIVAGIAVIARCVTRAVVARSYGLEEVLIVIAILTSIGLTVLICERMKHSTNAESLLTQHRSQARFSIQQCFTARRCWIPAQGGCSCICA